MNNLTKEELQIIVQALSQSMVVVQQAPTVLQLIEKINAIIKDLQ